MTIEPAIVEHMNTTISVPGEIRDQLARVAVELRVPSMAEALKVLIFRYDSAVALAKLKADPEEFAAYIAEAQALAEMGLDDIEDWVWE